ncbi:MAG: hypothetical protein KGH89_05090 [Thaumarchaeota archaeon]|nr:hypothetical protein [Nitrososphaerota archaeon]
MKSESLLLLDALQDIASAASLGSQDEDLVKSVFKKILDSGDTYNMTELESWFSKVVSANQSAVDRVLNIAHYQKSKFEARNKFRMISDGDDCGCGGGH